ncbi:MAG: bile acid:sodium symporter family protein [Alphaproteobacteria bacterium]|nr:bile acid:sodium symporter family protein [Alphaproteobacteria bacterium]
MTPNSIDDIALNFNPASLILLNIVVGLIMFGIALDLRPEDFRQVLRTPRAAVIGLLAQFVVLPAVTFGIVVIAEPRPSIALGMFLVAACPPGNLSNYLTHFAKGNTALSVSMSAVSTVCSIAMTPFNLAFWASLYPPARDKLATIVLDPLGVVLSVAALIGIPIAAGLWLNRHAPLWAERLKKPARIFSLVALGGFILAALVANWANLVKTFDSIFAMIVIQDVAAIASGYFFAWLARLDERSRRAVAFETGMRNTGLGLALVFSHFGGLGGMAVIAAGWGIWHICGGLPLAWIWSKRPPPPAA